MKIIVSCILYLLKNRPTVKKGVGLFIASVKKVVKSKGAVAQARPYRLWGPRQNNFRRPTD